ncbi:MAG: bifunctional [glutamate--ammonia ligase]-adenylyl-L-tyrosine phosphorylase/[glutamate--ammonia-ligase] adenylyltransferase [Kofleriaceae bacterium]|nr:bifunctional [glutamate--ammonia ligase]-adenylyl-L-tyrosine phosphorylase/[glutamate--ammonia-ligase] adenylyltransferase [Kofleriaceae bacterium]
MTGPDLVRQIAENAPDPADASRRAERWLEAWGGDPASLPAAALDVLALSCRRAPYLATLCTRDPSRPLRVAAGPYLRREKPAAEIAAEVDRAAAAATTADELARALRRVRADELVRLGARELAMGLDTEVGRELAHLADACFDAALRFHDARLRERHGPPRYTDEAGVERDAGLCVIAMGKHGGLELNFASDVDVIYVYSSDAGAAGALSLHEYFAKLALAVTQALADVTAEDVVFRVDLRLRPEGSRGAIANSLAQVERYYETFGRPWERQAWIKARPCAGDRALGDEVMRTLLPFVHPRHTSPTIVDEVHALNRRIKRELDPGAGRAAGHGDGAAGFDVKNGQGGIREIEFFVQALQLVHAGRSPALRARGTLAALDALLFAGLVTDDEHLALHRAYRWLRHVEHLLQLEGGLQTQRLPRDPTALDVVARRAGQPDAAALGATLAHHSGRVAALFATLGDPGAASESADAEDGIGHLARGELPAELERVELAALGFADPAAAARASSSGAPAAVVAVVAGRRRRGGPGPAAPCSPSWRAPPIADAALRHAADPIGKRGAAWSVWRLLDEQRALLRLLGSILGASEYLARSIVERPELIDLLVEVGQETRRDRAALERDADRRLAAAHAADPGDAELAWSALAEFKNGQVLRVGLADFAGRLGPLEVCADLTAIAEVCLERAFDRVAAELRARHGVVREPGGGRGRLAVLGLGKLGGRELGYAADLDVVFVHDGAGDSDGERPLTAVEYFSRLGQRLVGGLHARTPRGRLYEVDTRLRPSGSKGLLVSSLAGWRRYHAREARLWERQALIKLRPVAGDPELGAEVAAEVASWLWSTPPPPARAIAGEIVAMRDRLERELGSPGDLKVGKGGIIDVEFAAQFLQLAHGHAVPGLRTPSTAPALRAARAAGLAAGNDLELLEDGYRFLRLIEHRLRVVHDRAVHRLPDDPGELGRLARRCGFGGGDALRERLARWQRDIRAAFERVLGAAT